MSKSKTTAKQPEADKRPDTAKQPEPELKKAPVKAVQAVFVPVGHVKVHLETPSGNEYNLVPREVFTIAAEDVAWFFTDWHWSFRQRLMLAKDYHPTCGYHDPKEGGRDYKPKSPYHPKPTAPAPAWPVDAAPRAVVVTETEADSGEKE